MLKFSWSNPVHEHTTWQIYSYPKFYTINGARLDFYDGDVLMSMSLCIYSYQQTVSLSFPSFSFGHFFFSSFVVSISVVYQKHLFSRFCFVFIFLSLLCHDFFFQNWHCVIECVTTFEQYKFIEIHIRRMKSITRIVSRETIRFSCLNSITLC